ncbi:MAG: folate-binding protein [Pseudomonadota bacterium]
MTASNDLARRVIRIKGGDREDFLQGLVTNDVSGLKNGLVYTALLSPQGKYLADFFLVPEECSVLLDCDADLAPDLIKRLTLYKLRADVQFENTDIAVSRGTDAAPEGSFADPRHPALGWRLYAEGQEAMDGTDWTALRVRHLIPESGTELVADDSYILEFGFDRIHGVDFRKGCFVGQEIVARMKHKTELRKGLVQVHIEGSAPPGTEITAGGKLVGRLGSQSGDMALAHLRFDRAKGEMEAGTARLRRAEVGADLQ